ncbi:DUF1835 domain-containing protein [Cohnella sp. 56]|uniref:DUF1835 domain-containing protein n=1 Tax=Cohnella sp. 56 TaxID=3113722 RepID=UPI0030E77CCE
MLHIVNGDVVGDKLRQGSVGGDILVWREVYPVGPLWPDMDEPGQRQRRAAYLERTLGVPADEYEAHCESQAQMLQRFSTYDEVVLWFEHDLFDQLMLSYLLHWFAKRALGRTKLNLLCIGDYPGIESFRGLGQLTIGQLEALSGTWTRIGQQELEAGTRIWNAYTSPDIERHAALLHEDISALPFARAALESHLSRLPSAMNGLGIVEQTTLELIRQGAATPNELFKEIGDRLSVLGMGDLEYWYRLRAMSEQPDALVVNRGSEVALTAFGLAVADGAQDWMQVKDVNEWYGGLHLHRDIAWRWDAKRAQLVW